MTHDPYVAARRFAESFPFIKEVDKQELIDELLREDTCVHCDIVSICPMVPMLTMDVFFALLDGKTMEEIKEDMLSNSELADERLIKLTTILMDRTILITDDLMEKLKDDKEESS